MASVFLLSPANTSGIRANQLVSPRSKSDAAMLYRSDEGVPIADAFIYMSALYFRGKIAYARHFAAPENVFVIAPGFGLVRPDWRITVERMAVLRKTDVSVKDEGYVRTLRETAASLADALAPDSEIVLLGSVASGKYVDVLQPVFGDRLRFPAVFAGLGDMSRGGLLLRAVRANRELEYTTLDAPRKRAPGGTGKIPDKW
ncbi:MAG: hypothetical protein WA208_01335 [Thermoanaerobaculia bacterium]